VSGFRLQYIGPVILITLCLLTLSAVTAVSLFHQQAAINRVLRDNIESRRIAVEVEQCLADLIALEEAHVEEIEVLHDRLRTLRTELATVADQPEEARLHQNFDEAFARYHTLWDAMPPQDDPGHEPARRAATRVLIEAALPSCRDFRLFNGRMLAESAANHERILRRLAWGMAGVGGLGGVAGLVLGFGVAKGLSRSIRRLRVQIRDAAGLMGSDLPEIVVTEDGGFQNLHAEVEGLASRVEQVVGALQAREHEVLRAEQLAAVGQLAAGVAHEIRNPLTSIKMLVQSAQEAPSGGLTPEDLEVIESEVRRMEGSLRRFLDFARPPRLERRATPLAPLVQSVLDLVRTRAGSQRVALRLDAEGDLRLTVDPEQLRQVLLNLTLNALDAMPRGGELHIGLGRGPDGRVRLDFQDSGPGIPAAVLPRLFEPFVSSKDTGLGLGLVISRRIIEDHGGALTAANRPEGGARFSIELPGDPQATATPTGRSAHAHAPGR
jgi:signal transduction histidine kinase